MVVAPRLIDGPLASPRLRAIVVGQHQLVLAALSRLLSGPPLNASVEMLTDTDQAIDRIEDGDHDLLFCDLKSPPIPPAELPARLQARQRRARVILLADDEDAGRLLEMLDCGAAGFFTKSASADEFIAGVEAVAAGHLAIGRPLASEALVRFSGRRQGSGGLYARLSPAEREVLAMLDQACSTREIAAARGISDRTVRNHMANIYRKLQVRNRSEAIMWSLRMRRGEGQTA